MLNIEVSHFVVNGIQVFSPLPPLQTKLIVKLSLFESFRVTQSPNKDFCIFNEPSLSLSQRALIYLPKIKSTFFWKSNFLAVQNFIRFKRIAHGELRDFLYVLKDIENKYPSLYAVLK